MRANACSSTVGFQWGSIRYARDAAVRLSLRESVVGNAKGQVDLPYSAARDSQEHDLYSSDFLKLVYCILSVLKRHAAIEAYIADASMVKSLSNYV